VPSNDKPIANPNPETEILVPAPVAPAPTPGTIIKPDNAPEAPDTSNNDAPERPAAAEASAEPDVAAMQRTFPITLLDNPRWVEVSNVGGAPICDVRDGSPLELVPHGKRFLAKYFAVREVEGTHPEELQYYVISPNMAAKELTQGIDPKYLIKSAAPSVDPMSAKQEAGEPFEINLDDFGKAGRTFLKALHALFGDWHVFKLFSNKDKNKE
jgi:hypothetical protein